MISRLTKYPRRKAEGQRHILWKRLSSGVATLCKLSPLLGVLACCYLYASHGDEAAHRRLPGEDAAQDQNEQQATVAAAAPAAAAASAGNSGIVRTFADPQPEKD